MLCRSPRTRARLRFRFLASPKRVLAEGGRVVGLAVEENRLERKGDRIVAIGTGETSVIPPATVVFAVGDRVDEDAGLPSQGGQLGRATSRTRRCETVEIQGVDGT